MSVKVGVGFSRVYSLKDIRMAMTMEIRQSATGKLTRVFSRVRVVLNRDEPNQRGKGGTDVSEN